MLRPDVYFLLLFWLSAGSLCSAYRIIHWDNYCLNGEKQVFKLGNSGANSAYILQLTKITSPNSTKHLKCHIMVEASKGYGVLAIIEHLSLRRSVLDENVCYDSLTFGLSIDGRLSKICGERNAIPYRKESWANDTQAHPVSTSNLILSGPNANAFHDRSGKLHIWLNEGFDSKFEEAIWKMELTVVITPYKIACRTDESRFYRCPRMENAFEPCIARQLHCDGHVNCGNESISDESFCEEPVPSPYPMSTATLIVVGMTVVIFSALLCGLLCCWRSRAARRHRARRSQELQSERERTYAASNTIILTNQHFLPQSGPASNSDYSCVRMTDIEDPLRQLDSNPPAWKEDPPPSYADLFPDVDKPQE